MRIGAIAMSDNQAYVPDTWFQKVVNWHALRGFGQSKIASLSIATPFVGYLILYHEALRPFMGGLGGLIGSGSHEQCGPWISFIGRLNCIYFGALSLGIGTIIYRVFAHPVIKRFDDISDYVERQISTVTARNLRSMFVTIMSRRSGVARQLLRRAEWLDRSKVDFKVASDAFSTRNDRSLSVDVLRSYYNVRDRYEFRPLATMTAILYLIGFGLLAIPGLFFTARVGCVIVFGD